MTTIKPEVFQAVIDFVLLTDNDPIFFLAYWRAGDFLACREGWPDAPESVYPELPKQPEQDVSFKTPTPAGHKILELLKTHRSLVVDDLGMIFEKNELQDALDSLRDSGRARNVRGRLFVSRPQAEKIDKPIETREAVLDALRTHGALSSREIADVTGRGLDRIRTVNFDLLKESPRRIWVSGWRWAVRRYAKVFSLGDHQDVEMPSEPPQDAYRLAQRKRFMDTLPETKRISMMKTNEQRKLERIEAREKRLAKLAAQPPKPPKEPVKKEVAKRVPARIKAARPSNGIQTRFVGNSPWAGL